jgi:hypothetical protein
MDPQFKSLLKHHWMEEAQHAKLDNLMIEGMREACSDSDVAGAVDEYLKIGGLLDGGLMQQVQFDLEAFERATGRRLNRAERDRFVEVQQQATRWTFLGSGMTHANFLALLESMHPEARKKVETVAPAFCWPMASSVN